MDSAALIEVRGKVAETKGKLSVKGRTFDCALGSAGIVASKHEGDGGTPQGRFPLRELRYRADRLARPATGLPAFVLEPNDGWCDAPDDPAYNRKVTLPYAASHEALCRDDHLYDYLVVIGYNDSPVRAGRGSAIFLHVANLGVDGLQPTAGCVALGVDDLLTVLSLCGVGTKVDIRLT